MRKGNYGIAYAFYAVLAFVFALFGQSLLLCLLTVFLIVVEKDEWASKQSLQACGIVGAQWIISKAISLIGLPVAWIGRFITDYSSGFYKFESVWNKIFYFVGDFVDIAFLVITIMAIMKVMKGTDAKVPVISKFADWAYGIGGAKKCPKCGAEVKGNFCDKCGTKLD